MRSGGIVMTEPRSVVITGASRGLGLASATHLYNRGWRVVGAMRNPDLGLDRMRESCGASASDARLLGVQLDLTNTESIASGAKAIEQAVGAPYALVHNAGITAVGCVEEVGIDVWHDLFATNLFGPVMLTQALLPSMRAAGKGRIVIISSAGGVRGMPAIAAYSAVKGASERWGESMANELAPFGIGVSVIVTGTFDTEIITDEGAPDYRGFDGAYAPINNNIEKRGRFAIRFAQKPSSYARGLEKAVNDNSSFSRRAVGVDAHLISIASRLLPSKVPHHSTRLAMGLPGRGSVAGGQP